VGKRGSKRRKWAQKDRKVHDAKGRSRKSNIPSKMPRVRVEYFSGLLGSLTGSGDSTSAPAKTMQNPKPEYMRHIDGLRCLAVMSVLLFHFGVPGMGGGYVGVDVFFVISGYLITKTLTNELTTTGDLSFKNFYARRMRRILPALISTITITTVLAVVTFTPGDLVGYGKSVAASAISMSNVLFWSESGYFDAASKTKPLLHTWSLSVEEQFYMFWPAFIYMSFKLFGKKWIGWSVVAAGVFSFALNGMAVSEHGFGYRSDLFFLAHFRVFEFAIGAIGGFVTTRLPSSRLANELMMAMGLTLICASVALLAEGVVFPYVNALAPCFGAFLVISASRASFVGTVLTNKISVWIGKISYSLYLTHWPIVVVVDQCLPSSAWPIKFALMASLSFATAIFLHYKVEVVYRYGSSVKARNRVVLGALAASSAACALGALIFFSNGMMWRYDYFVPGYFGSTAFGEAEFKPLSAEEIDAGKSRRWSELGCNILSLNDQRHCFMTRPKQVLIFGNSHEPDGFNIFNYIYSTDKKFNLISFGTVNDCEFAISETGVSSSKTALSCDKRFEVLNSDDFVSKLEFVVYNTHKGFDYTAKDLWSVLALLKKKNPNIKIIAIGSYIQTTMECATLYNKFKSYEACGRQEFVNYFNPEERAKSPIPEVKSLDYLYISKYKLLCKGNRPESCVKFANGEPMFYDQHHLSLGFAKYIGELIALKYRAELAEIGLPVPNY
jgi:peptidoglycan/LPS O-acetylase OafA/YrhL